MMSTQQLLQEVQVGTGTTFLFRFWIGPTSCEAGNVWGIGH
jgi:hypothetical protein